MSVGTRKRVKLQVKLQVKAPSWLDDLILAGIALWAIGASCWPILVSVGLVVVVIAITERMEEE